jgi:hypothetical protein
MLPKPQRTVDYWNAMNAGSLELRRYWEMLEAWCVEQLRLKNLDDAGMV